MDEKYQIVSVNGQFVNREDFHVGLSDRAFRFGDGLFETMHANGLDVQFLDEHYQRLLKGASILGLNIPDEFSLEYLINHIKGLLTRCKLFQGAKVRLMVYRAGEGLFIPATNEINIIIEAKYLSKGPYQLNEKGLVLGVYKDMRLNYDILSGFKTMNALPYILAGTYINKNSIDDALLLNASGKVTEATSSNVFALKDKHLYTPGASSGCVDGIMRKNILKIADKMGFEVNENAVISPESLIEFDELFLTNAVCGIKWVTGFGNHRYYKRYSIKLMNELNRMLF